ncbi:hypothetical protein 055SW001_58 [Bacillus phage 055SW001]|nr:hypothetical protein 022DV001_58 [Bacillus phage 022DV001]QFG05808.1 hypothetical protein 055SW001_58 [Bacillus phage 055SW001]
MTKKIRFGNAEIAILSDRTTFFSGFTAYKVTAKISKGTVEGVYMANEVIDLIAVEVGCNPLHNAIFDRAVFMREGGVFDAYWTSPQEEIRQTNHV